MDYLFFDPELQARFTRRLADSAVPWQEEADKMVGNIVRIADDLDEDLSDELEDLYDQLFDEQAALAAERDGWVNKRLAGVQAFLPDGREITVALPPDLANRLLAHFQVEEIAAIVNAVANSLHQDYNGPLCKHPLGTI